MHIRIPVALSLLQKLVLLQTLLSGLDFIVFNMSPVSYSYHANMPHVLYHFTFIVSLFPSTLVAFP